MRVKVVFGILTVFLVGYAIFLPAFEGPDEPFHLSRALDIARGQLESGWRGEELHSDIAIALRTVPCGPDLQRAFGCLPFESAQGAKWGNLVSGSARETDAPPQPESELYPNYERQHPPLGYMIWAAPIAVVDRLGFERPVSSSVSAALLTMRLTCVAIVLLSLIGPGRRLTAGWSEESKLLGLGCVLLPGAVETLARGGLEALVFGWSCWFLATIRLHPGKRVRIGLLAAAGPLIKLTAIPVVVFVVLRAFLRREPRTAAVVLASSCTVHLERLARGYSLGGVLDLHSQYSGSLLGNGWEIALGVCRSALVSLKSAVWLGGWSFFRPPIWILVLIGLGALTIFTFLRANPMSERADSWAALGALGVAASGHVVFSLAVYRVFGSWAVGGWYLWAWLPVAAVAAERTLALKRPLPRWLLPAAAAALVVVDLIWWAAADSVYG